MDIQDPAVLDLGPKDLMHTVFRVIDRDSIFVNRKRREIIGFQSKRPQKRKQKTQKYKAENANTYPKSLRLLREESRGNQDCEKHKKRKYADQAVEIKLGVLIYTESHIFPPLM
jgi:hypothetical protein